MSPWSATSLALFTSWLVWTVSTQNEPISSSEVIKFLDDFDAAYSPLKSRVAEVEYELKTNLTSANEDAFSKIQLDEAKFRREWAENATKYDNVTDSDQRRQLDSIKDIGEQWQTDESKSNEMNNILNRMSSIYGKAKICLNNKPCIPMEPDIHDLMANSVDYDELLEAWVAWRDATGRKMKSDYVRFVELFNEAIRLSGHRDAGEYWRSSYETPTFEEDLQDLLYQIRPLYEHLHAYVRKRLIEIYPKDKFPATGHIPAHLLGDMWAQEWTTIIDRVKPYKDKPSLDVTDKMKEQGYNVTSMFETAESFFQSLGWDPMVPSFWTKSLMERPRDGREVVCHASAWDFNNQKDFAIKMCASVTQQDLMVIHHEMGHIQYYMHYKDQPTVYREGANHGFHEAIGDVMSLSAQTPEHLKKIKLLDVIPNDSETDINFLMNMALQKIAFIPFGYLIDQWRWSVFSGETKPEKYTDYWWELRCRHQGVAPPVARSPEDFDPGAKYHVANNVPYIRYFISFVIQFQFHKAACQAANYTGPLHRCDIYESKVAGKRIGDMLAMGSSKPWPEAMKKVTGQEKMDAGPLLEYFEPLLKFLMESNGNDYGWDPHCPVLETHVSEYKSPLETCNSSSKAGSIISSVDRAEEFLRGYDTEAEGWRHAQAEAEFNYESNLTDDNKNKKIAAELDLAKFDLQKQHESWRYNVTGLPENVKRQFKFIRDIGQSAQSDQTKLKRLEDAKLEMQSIYGKAKVCLKSDQCMSLEPELTQLMAESRDYDQLLAAWKGWRDVTGPKMKKKYAEYVDLYNEAIRLSCFKDGGEYWRSWYDSATFEEDIAQLYSQVQPLYQQLHAYVRRKLKAIYPKDKFPASGHIPAHILGNMWAQDWTKIVKDIVPYPDKPTVDVTDEMKTQNYNASMIFHKAEDFFVSLGLPHMVHVFWEKSVMVKPNGTEMVCHATAYDLQNRQDFRIKMCTDITQKDLVTVHHEMGHIEYYMQYKDQPAIFREGANNGFHEAIGDVMALSVQTPEHLYKMGLLKEIPKDPETDINFLYKMALQKVAFLPFGYLIDMWRWSVFSGQTQPDSYTQDWWKLRCRLQGLYPPVERSSYDFDPGAKYHVPAAVPYIRYFVSYVIQFQFHKAACQASGYKGPLHRCDIYNSKEAGKLIGDMLKMGRSKPWPDAMEKITGQRKMDASPLLEYFKPLMDFLVKENKNDFGWDPQCPVFEKSHTDLYISPLESCNTSKADNVTADVDEAEKFLSDYDKEAQVLKFQASEAEFNYESNLTEYNKNVSLQRQLAKAEFDLRKQKESWGYNVTSMPEFIRRQFRFVRDIGANAQPNKTKLEKLKQSRLDMQSIYGKGEVCLNKKCMPLEPDLTQLMASSSDYNELLAVWTQWRDVTGKKMKTIFSEYVDLYNEAVQISCFKDAGEYWRSWYDSPTFEEDIADLYAQIRPLYEQLHAYVRKKLQQKYNHVKFPSSGHIPAHILGNMWAQEWTNLIKDVVPYKDKPTVDVTDELKKQGYTAKKIFETADSFFGSLGLIRMVPEFWKNSIIVKQNGTDMVCHATAYDLYNGKDFRIKMCTDITQENLVTVHHEMGHVEYYMQYKDLPIVFRDGANNGFHEAIGDVMALSVQTPEHLHKINLLKDLPTDSETDINFLMKMSLEKVAFLPFGYLIDLWRWSVFSGKTTSENYTNDWWKLRCRLQGVYPPVKRSSEDFDPGAKYHIPSDTPYIRYFISFIIQFQFHKAACQAAGYKGPLHRCDIYNNTDAGRRIGNMLKLGASKPWPDAMEVITGQRKMDASALLEYFHPLLEFLKKENGDDFGWAPHCPDPEGQIPRDNQPDCKHNNADRPHTTATSLIIFYLFVSLVRKLL